MFHMRIRWKTHMRKVFKNQRSVREYIMEDDIENLDKKLRYMTPKKAKKEKGKDEPTEFEWTADPRLNNKRNVQTKSIFEEELSSKKLHREQKRIAASKDLIRDLFKDNLLSRQDRDIVNKKMQDHQFLNDIYLLDQALGGAPDFKEQISNHIKKLIKEDEV
jgi:hypothetical protein